MGTESTKKINIPPNSLTLLGAEGNYVVVFTSPAEKAAWLFDFNTVTRELAMKRMQVTWSVPGVKGTAPQPRQNHTAVIIDHKMYVFGGTTTNKKVLGDMNVLDLESLTWSTAEPTGHPPSARYGHSCVVYQKLLLVFGGFDGSKRLNDVYKYDTIKNVWIQPDVKGEKPDARSSHCAALLGNTRMDVYGGVISGKVTGNMFVLNLGNWTWSEIIPKGTIPKARFNHAAVVLEKFFLYCWRTSAYGKI